MKRSTGRQGRQRISLLLCLIWLLIPAAQAELPVTWMEGEAWFPDEQAWTYHYQYLYPVLSGEDAVSEAINHYFDLALNEMANLVLPMYAADPIMAGKGGNRVSEQWRVTCNSDDFFSALLHRTQTVEGTEVHTVSSVVFAASGEYAGDSLTLRGLVRGLGTPDGWLLGTGDGAALEPTGRRTHWTTRDVVQVAAWEVAREDAGVESDERFPARPRES